MMKLIKHYVRCGTRKLDNLQRNINTLKKVLNRDTSNESVLSVF